MSKLYVKRVWEAMEVIRQSFPQENFDMLESLMLDQRESGAAMQDLERLALAVQAVVYEARKPWWQKVLGW